MKHSSSLPILMQTSFWWWQCSDRYIISLSPHLRTPSHSTPFSPSLISLTVSVDVKHHVYLLMTVSSNNCFPSKQKEKHRAYSAVDSFQQTKLKLVWLSAETTMFSQRSKGIAYRAHSAIDNFQQTKAWYDCQLQTTVFPAIKRNIIQNPFRYWQFSAELS